MLLKLTDKRVFRHPGGCVRAYTVCAVSTCHITEYLQYHGRGRTRAPCHQARWPPSPHHNRAADLLDKIILSYPPSHHNYFYNQVHPTALYPGFPPGITILPFAVHQSLSYPERCRTLVRKQVPQQEAAETVDKTKWLKTSAELYHLATEVLKLGLCRSGKFLKGPVFGC